MLVNLRGLAGSAAAAALAACCLAATACGGGTGRAQDPLAGLTATGIAGKVFDDFKAATSLKLDGTITEQGGATHVDVALTSHRESVIDGAAYPGIMEGCAGTARFTSPDGKDTLGGYRFFALPAAVYVSPDAAYWGRTSGLGSGKSYSLIAGKYVLFRPSGDSDLAQQVQLFCDRQMLMDYLNTTGTLTKGAVTTFDGIRVMPIKDSGGLADTTEYVTDTSRPEVAELSWHMPGVSDGRYTITVGAPVTVSAPPPARVIAAADFGG